jgi:hypothetical protein
MSYHDSIDIHPFIILIVYDKNIPLSEVLPQILKQCLKRCFPRHEYDVPVPRIPTVFSMYSLQDEI